MMPLIVTWLLGTIAISIVAAAVSAMDGFENPPAAMVFFLSWAWPLVIPVLLFFLARSAWEGVVVIWGERSS